MFFDQPRAARVNFVVNLLGIFHPDFRISSYLKELPWTAEAFLPPPYYESGLAGGSVALDSSNR